MDISIYRNLDGTYTSPKTGKIYKSEKAIRSHLSFRKTEDFYDFVSQTYQKVNCTHCDKTVGKNNIKMHETSCYRNPKNLRECEVCKKPIKNFRTSKGTCSKACSNTLFRSGENNGNWKQDAYQSTCFLYHGKKCIICEESLIVDVHHLDENRENNDPSNLIPLCPNHHRYWHSRYRYLIEDKVYAYVDEWKSKNM